MNPALFDIPTFNGAHISQALDIDYALFHEKTNKFNELEWVIINLSYGRPFNTLRNSGEKWRYKNYNLYYHIDLDYIASDHAELLSNDARTAYKKWAKYYLHHESDLDCDSLGFSANFDHPTDTLAFQEKSENAAKRHTNADWSLLKDNLSIIQNIIDEAHDRNIKVLLFLPPADKSYIENLDKKQLEKDRSILKEFAQKNTNCFSIDLLENPDFIRNDFFDPDHLNVYGAAKLTRIVNAFINEKATRK